MNIAVLGGTGRQGQGLALRFAQAGHEVWVGSRTEAKAQQAVAAMRSALGPGAALHPADNAAAVRRASVVFLTVPHPHEYPTVTALKADLTGKLLVDVSVPLTRFKPPEVTLPPEGSAAEGVQAIVGAGVPVVAAFKATSAIALQKLNCPPNADELVCGESAEAKGAVIELIESLGARAFDAGPLRNARALELLTGVLMDLGQRYGRHDVGIFLSL